MGLCPDDAENAPDENGDGCDDREQWFIDITILMFVSQPIIHVFG